jgi:nitrate reductase assembly molybdenum cofactor insertion protein NarJ
MTGYNKIAHIRALYEKQAKAKNSLDEKPDFLSLPGNPAYKSRPDSLADRIFGRQLEEKQLWTAHFENILGERNRIYHHQMEEIQEEISHLKGRLESLSRPYSIHPPQLKTQLERILWQTGNEQRREQVRFWKDLLDIKDRMIQNSIEYRQTQDRSTLLQPEEEKYNG